MYEITKKDALVLGVLANYGCAAHVDEAYEGEVKFFIDSYTKVRGSMWVNEDENFTDNLIAKLKENTPKEGTPNSEMSDEQKGLIQLLFEVEKAIA